MADTLLSEVTGMVFLVLNSVMVHTTGVTTTTAMLSVSSDSTVSVGHMTSLMSQFPQTSYHF